MRPAGVVFLNNIINWLKTHDVAVSFSNLAQTPALMFLDDSLFFERHCGEKLNANSSPRATTRPLVQIAHKDSHAWLADNLVPWLAGRLNLTQASLYDVKSVVSELFNNIQDHTRYDIGSIFAQHFPGEKQVNISLSDWGIGIPENVRKKIPDLSDADAIIKATEEGFTTKSRPTNLGLGLDNLLHTIVEANGGAVTIYSGQGIVRFRREGGIVRSYVEADVGFCPGTTIDLNLKTDAIEEIPDRREDLLW